MAGTVTTSKKRKHSGARTAKAAPTPSLTPADIRALAKECLESKGKLNNIVTLLRLCESDHEETAFAAFKAMGVIYTHLLQRGDLTRRKAATSTNSTTEPPTDAKSKVATWLRENRSIYIQLALSYLCTPNVTMQIAAFDALISIVKDESHVMSQFHNDLYSRIVEKLVTTDKATTELIEKVTSTVDQYADARFYFYKDLAKVLSGTIEGGKKGNAAKRVKTTLQNQDVIIAAAYRILSRISDPLSEDQLTSIWEAESEDDANEEPNQPQLLYHTTIPSAKETIGSSKEQRRVFSDCWLALLRHPLSLEQHKSVLQSLHKRIIPYMLKPTLLIDYLVDSYEQGGAISMLALNGLFTLITEYNLDYPDFYTKLYALFDKNLLHLKYRSRFLRLVDLFLSSNRLPSYIVAAFLKRMARLCLSAPPPAVIALIPFIYNLLKKHSACLCLIHRETDPAAPMTIDSDPYDMTQSDLSKCRAMESSLWEIMTLKNHYHHTISGLARVFEEPIAKQPIYDLEDFLDHSYGTLFENEVQKFKEGAAGALAVYAKTVGVFQVYDGHGGEESCFSL
ncbi:hypothetical protein HDU85_003183 [Gaertneriomyces sp. JEL0708]|nr:hypothetical protein HDU85_003183 [Gaertneriomyces sp. JEL0708]